MAKPTKGAKVLDVDLLRIGKPKRRVVVEPLPDKAPPEREPTPRREPREPDKEPGRREKTPA